MAINGIGAQAMGRFRAPELNAQERQQQAVEDDSQVDRSPASQVARFVETSDEMAAALRSQFRRRNELNEKADSLSDSFDRVLEENVLPKALGIQALAGQAGKSLEWLLLEARRQFPDPSDLVMVLRGLLAQDKMTPMVRQRLEALLAMVIAQTPPKPLKAGINTALKARLFGRRLRLRASALRNTYRHFLESEEGPVDAYENWIALYGEQYRADVLDFIEAAVLTDCTCVDPSCTPAEFGTLMIRLSELKLLRSADHAFVRRVLGQPCITDYNSREADWLVFMLGLLRYPGQVRQLLQDALGQALLMASAKARGAALQCLRQACLALPGRLFTDDEACEQVAEQFSQLATLTHTQERIDHLAALHHFNTSQTHTD
ncbi:MULTISPECIES: type III secretion system gatekeeper subunit SctW [Pseudomonas]|uniref:Type III secretion system gatekeeper subunit SctW n=1 Tax=Pseudomonas quercus TaxID=2722792 RepID=A0ABX0YBR1_9PSED|nr:MULTISPECIES: type III secretion system gatekeeper subunit SctW [Pseudomonas]MBF7141003.1 type III secretion system gatekeeper subunit SctW [Pseudomonas sp. LY10J]NJO99537.1 type III secretion system gatekeeper subunit SctW [Pseudomonas quercus]